MFKKTFALLFGISEILIANPTSAPYQTEMGSVTVTGIGTSTVTVNANATTNVVKWADFSINNGENVIFTRNSSSTPYYIVNKITGGTASTISGNLTSGDNGNIYLINEAGVIITSTGNIVTGSFLASTLALVNDFVPGEDLEFIANTTNTLVNRGTVQAINGDLYLIGYRVTSSGSVVASGAAGIGAGTSILLKANDTQGIYIEAAGAAGTGTGIDITSTGTINGETISLIADGNPYTLAINLGGAITATTCVSTDGNILLVADPTTHDKGAIEISGSIQRSTTSGTGPQLQIYGASVALKATADIDLSGDTGGAGITIGQSSGYVTDHIYIAPGASIASNGVTSGSGGTITLWAGESLLNLGNISATGAGSSGNGGSVTLTSPGYFGMDVGSVNLSVAGSGTVGTTTITTGLIELGGTANYGANFAPPNYTMTNVSSNITKSNLQTTLGVSKVSVNANSVVAGNPNGTIDLIDNISWSSGNSLTLVANESITIPYTLTMTGSSSAASTVVSLTAPEITVGNALQTQTNSAGILLTTGGISVSASDYLAVYGGESAGSFSAIRTGNGNIGISFKNGLTLLAGDNAGANAEMKGTAVTINGLTAGVGNILVQAEDCSQAFIDGATINIGTTIRPRNVTVIGGKCSSDNEAYIGSLTGGSNVTMNILGDLSLTGGATGSGNKASIVSSGGVAKAITVSASNILLSGGSGGSNNSARISSNGSSGIVTLTTTQDLMLTGGSSSTTASTAHIKGTTVQYTTGRDTILTGGTGLLNKVYIQGYGGVIGVVGRNLTMNGGSASLTSAEIQSVNGNVTIDALQTININGGGPGSETQSAIYATEGDVHVKARLNVNLTTGTSTTADAYIYAANGAVEVIAERDLTLTGSCTIPNIAYIESNGSLAGLTVSSRGNIIRIGNTAIKISGPSNALASVSAGNQYLIFGCSTTPSGGEEEAPLNEYYKYYFLYELFYRLTNFNYYDWFLYHSQDFWTNANYTDP